MGVAPFQHPFTASWCASGGVCLVREGQCLRAQMSLPKLPQRSPYQKVGQVDDDDVDGPSGAIGGTEVGSEEVALSAFVLRVVCVAEVVIALLMGFSHCFWFIFFVVEATVGLGIWSHLLSSPSRVVAAQISTFLKVKVLTVVFSLFLVPFKSLQLFSGILSDGMKLVGIVAMSLLLALSCFAGIVAVVIKRKLASTAGRDMETGGAEGEQVPLTVLGGSDRDNGGLTPQLTGGSTEGWSNTGASLDAEWEAEKIRLQEMERAHQAELDQELDRARELQKEMEVDRQREQGLGGVPAAVQEKKAFNPDGVDLAALDPGSLAMVEQLRSEGRVEEANELLKVIAPPPAASEKPSKKKEKKSKKKAANEKASNEVPVNGAPAAAYAPPAPAAAPVVSPAAAAPAAAVRMASPASSGANGSTGITLGQFEQMWVSAPYEQQETMDMVFPLESNDVEGFMDAADFVVVASGAGEDGMTKMYFYTIASKVPLLFTQDNTAVLVEVLYDKGDSQITFTCKSTDESCVAGAISHAMDLFAG